MSFWHPIRSRPALTLIDTAVGLGIAGLAAFRIGQAWAAARRKRKTAAAAVIHTWEGEGGNIVPPQPSDATIADPPNSSTS